MIQNMFFGGTKIGITNKNLLKNDVNMFFKTTGISKLIIP
jgi:hypothetical protein